MKKQTNQKRASTTSKPTSKATSKGTSKPTTSSQSGTTYTVKQGKTQMTFNSKTEARAAAGELKGATIIEGRKKVTHHRVSFTAKNDR